MKKVSDSTESKVVYGITLDTPLKFEWTWTEYETDEELVAAKDEMTLEEQRDARNAQRKNKARNAAQKVAADAAKIVKPTAENDPQQRLKDMLKTLLTATTPDGKPMYTEESGRALAAQICGVEWAK